MSATNAPDALGQLYQEVIRDHHKDPRNYGTIEKADASAEGFNPLCGDQVNVSLRFSAETAEKTLQDVRFQGHGCSICMASASMMTEEVVGKKSAEALRVIENFRELMQGNVDPESIEGDLQSLAGVRRFPVRIKCALLPWVTLKNALEGNADEKANTEKDQAT